jgi:hypothetical protein
MHGRVIVIASTTLLSEARPVFKVTSVKGTGHNVNDKS